MHAAGGAIRLVIPDIRRHVEMYLSGAEPMDSVAGRHYRTYGLTVEHPIDLVGHSDPDRSVTTPSTPMSQERELLRAGLHSPRRCELGESEHAELTGRAGLDNAAMRAARR